MSTGTSIFVRSFRTDRFWLEYCLRSLEKFAKGFLEIVVALPVGDEPHFYDYDYRGAKVVWYHDPKCSGYTAQQVCKMEADLYCQGDTILFLDSDCFITSEIRPEMFFTDAKPKMLLRHWDSVGENAKNWKEITKSFVGFTPMFEAMACPGLIYDRSTLALLRQHIEHTHKKTVREYSLVVQNDRLSEFNALGAIAHRFQPYLYDFRIANPSTDGYPRMIRQQWSYESGGVLNYKEEYERILAS